MVQAQYYKCSTFLVEKRWSCESKAIFFFLNIFFFVFFDIIGISTITRITMKPFQEYFSQTQFESYVAANFKDPDFVLAKALHSFLQDNHLLKPFLNHQTHITNFGYSWDKYLNNTLDERETHRLMHDIIAKLIFGTSFGKDNIEECYIKVRDSMNSGNLLYFYLPEAYDFESGERFNILFKNWEPCLLKFVPGEDWKSGKHIIAPEEPIQKLMEKQIEFKTGNLLVADWFKIAEFNKAVDGKESGFSEFDINCEKGRIEQSLHYLEKFNFIYNTSYAGATIFKNGDKYLFLNEKDDLNLPKEYKKKGYVFQELRALCIIEKEQLISIVGEEIVEKYLKENDVVSLKVNPGIYSFTLSSHPHFIKKNWKDLVSSEPPENLADITEFMEDKNFSPILILQSSQLTPKKFSKPRKKI